MKKPESTPNLDELKKIRKEKLKRKLERSLKEFNKWEFEKLKNQEFLENWHHDVLVDELEKVHRGETRFLLITIPPRYTKTELAVKQFMKWSFAKNPWCKFIHLSYSDELALDNSSEVKDTLMSEDFTDIWPIKLKGDAKSKKKWYTEINGKKAGGVLATATGGQVTGFGAGGQSEDPEEFEGAIIIDDPLKPDDARSEVTRKNINDRFNNTIKSRMNNPKKTPVIVIMQRLHEDDLAGFLLNDGSEYKFRHINLPAINEEGPNDYDPRSVGEALWPLKHDVEQLEAMQAKSKLVFAGQYQQRPAPAEGGIIKRDFIQYYKKSDLPKKGGMIGLSVDATFKGTKTADFVVIQAWLRHQNNFYLLDQIRDQLTFTQTLVKISVMVSKFPEYRALLIEDKANGSAIIDVLKKKFFGVIPITPTESKEARLQAVAPIWESGNVFLPENWDKLEIFENELLTFPNSKNDDQVDAMTQFIGKYAIGSSYSLEAMLTM